MSILSKVWPGKAHKEDSSIYSHVYEGLNTVTGTCDRVYGGVVAGPMYVEKVSYNSYADFQTWLVAKPVKGDEEKYRIYKHTNVQYSNNADTGLAPRLRSPSPDKLVDPMNGVYSKDQAIVALQQWEKDCEKGQKVQMAQSQPFGDRLVNKVEAKLNEEAKKAMEFEGSREGYEAWVKKQVAALPPLKPRP